VRTGRALLPDATPPRRLPVFAEDGEILPPTARATGNRASGGRR
jgi:hypothetical protein